MLLEWEGTLKTIFSGILIGDIDLTHPQLNTKREVFKQAVPLFKGMFQHNIFEDEYGVMFSFIQELKICVFNSDQLSLLLDQNKDIILNAESIDFDTILSTIPGLKEKAADIDKFEVFKMMALDRLKELSNNVVSVEDFKSACEIYKLMYIDNLTETMINNMAIIRSHGKKIKGFDGKVKQYDGLTGIREYYRDTMEIIDRLQDSTAIAHGIVDEEWLEHELDTEEKGDELKLIPFGLEEIDKDWGVFRRTQMLGVLGPPKGAKTRTCNYLVGAFLRAGYNVAIWPLEGHRTEWEAMQVANIIRSEYGVSVNSDVVLNKDYDEDVKQLVISAKTDLAIGATRGRLSFIGGAAYVENFIDELKSHYENVNAYDVIVIDSLVLVQSLKGKGKVDRISDSYNKLQNFIKNGLPRKPFAIIPAQLKQDVVDYLRKNPNETIDVTAGGESAETIRTPDYVLGVFSTEAERNAGQMKMFSVASRHTASFNNFYSRCELGCCYYESDPDLNN